MEPSMEPVGAILKALDFAARKHSHQRRKDEDASPYINHPIRVANVIWQVGSIMETEVLVAALLHDTLEDTETDYDELVREFGEKVAKIVLEVTDDKKLEKQVRKQLQIEHAPFISREAKLVKLGDKICNVEDVCAHPPYGWSLERKQEYLDWAEKVVNGVRGINPPLEAEFDQVLRDGKAKLITGNG
jgi:GTP diphosphokinase / guanosine-3',5'-bis(diphosphate) 3'-diphosphatase